MACPVRATGSKWWKSGAVRSRKVRHSRKAPPCLIPFKTLPIDLPLLLEDVGAVDRLDSWSAQSPFRRKRSALQRSNPYGFRIAVLNAIVPHDIENDRIAARVPIDL